MKKLLYMLLVVFASLGFTACGDDDLDANQYTGGIALNAYGPNPVTRGGTLRFVGSNLDQISYISIPGVEAITNYEVKRSGVPSEIWVTVPKEGPEPGYVTLTANDGTVLTTEQEVTYTEGVEFESFSPVSVMPGDVLTIEGEYLNLVEMVEFADEVYVGAEDFLSQSRHEITVTVPSDAQTGRVVLYTVNLIGVDDPSSLDYEAFQSEDALEVGTATVSGLASPRGTAEALGTITAKAGETITISGSYLSLISAIKFGDEDSDLGVYETSDFTVDDAGTLLTLTLPAEAVEGDINLVSTSGVEVPAGVLATVTPSNLSASPAPVKNGAALTISGADLDLVTAVYLPNVDDAVEASVSSSAIVIAAVPELAQEGDITLQMANGKTVSVAYTLVKPSVSAYSADNVNAGAALTISGTDLDLVQSVQFYGAEEVAEPTTQSESQLVVTVPMTSASGDVTLNLKNGTTVTAQAISVAEALFCYITESVTLDNNVQPGGTFTVGVKNADNLTAAYINGTQVQFVYNSNEETMTFSVPASAGGSVPLRLVSSNGEYTVNIYVNGEVMYDVTLDCVTQSDQSVAQTFPVTLAWDDTGRFRIQRNGANNLAAANLTAGTSKFTLHLSGTGSLQFNDANWTEIAECSYAEWSDASERDVEIVLTQDAIDCLNGSRSDGWSETAFIWQGQGLTITSIRLTE